MQAKNRIRHKTKTQANKKRTQRETCMLWEFLHKCNLEKETTLTSKQTNEIMEEKNELTNDYRQILDFYAQSTTKCHIRQGKTKCIPTPSKNSDSQLNTHSTIEDWRNLGKMKLLNEPGRQKLLVGRSTVSRHSMQSNT